VPIARLDTLLTEGWFDTSGYATNDQVQYALAEAAKVKHIVVVRTRELVAPTVEEATKTFTPGRAAGEVLVFSIPDGKRLGVLPFAVAQSGDSIRSMGLSGGDAVALEWRRQVLRHVIDLVVVGP